MGDCMRRFIAGILVTLLALAVVTQLALPAYLADRIEHRLEEGGGRADVKLRALPALTLVGRQGESLEVEAENLSFDIEEDPGDPFDDLDGFDRVDVDLSDSEAGPLQLERFELTREEPDGEYGLTVRGTTTPSELAQDIGSEAGGALGGLLGELGAEALPGGESTDVPFELTATIESDNGRPEVTDGSGSVAGVPAGPLTELVVVTVLERF